MVMLELNAVVDETIEKENESKKRSSDVPISRRAILGTLGTVGTGAVGVNTFSRVGSASPLGESVPEINAKEITGKLAEELSMRAIETDEYQRYINKLKSDGYRPVTEEPDVLEIESNGSSNYVVGWDLKEIGSEGRVADDEQSEIGRGQLVIGLDQDTAIIAKAGFVQRSVETMNSGDKLVSISTSMYTDGNGESDYPTTFSANTLSGSDGSALEKTSDHHTIVLPADRSGSDNVTVQDKSVDCVGCKAIGVATCAIGCGWGAMIICASSAVVASPVTGAACELSVGAICAAFMYVSDTYTGLTCTSDLFIRLACEYAGFC